MTTSTKGYMTWGTVAAAVLGVELASEDVLGLAPHPSLSFTTKKLIKDHNWLALLMLFALETFVVHILNPHKWGV